MNISSTVPTPEQNWKFLEPEFTGRITGNYRVYLDRFNREGSRPLQEIWVPLDAIHPDAEFYFCNSERPVPKGQEVNLHCMVRVVSKSGLVAMFYIPRKVVDKARDAAKFVAQSIDRFSESHSKGICK